MSQTILLDFLRDKKSGIVFFYSDHCNTCSHQKLLFSKVFSDKDYTMVCCDDDPDYFIREHGVDLIPVIRIYDNSEVVWEKIDLLSKEDVELLIDYVALTK